MATGWKKLWRNEEIAKQWANKPPMPEVIEMADYLEATGHKRVLDIGCGAGRHTLYLAARGFEIVALDNSSTALESCRRNLEAAGLQAQFIEAEMTQLPFSDAVFDGAIATQVIHHCYQSVLADIVKDITRILAPGGYFVWSTPSPRHPCCGQGDEVEPGTWVDEQHPEGAVPHRYCSDDEVRQLLAGYEFKSFSEYETVREGEDNTWHWRVLARKLESVIYDVPAEGEKRSRQIA